MASVYLVNALYKDKSSMPAAEIEQPATDFKQPVAGLEQSATEAKQQSDSMHPSRQQMVDLKGPLEEKMEPVIIQRSGANTLALGQKAPVISGSTERVMGIIHKPKLVSSPEQIASGEYRAARARSLQAVAPSIGAAMRLGQQAVGSIVVCQPASPLRGNNVNTGLDPRLRMKAEKLQDAASSPSSKSITQFGGSQIKVEETAWESFPGLPALKRRKAAPPVSPPKRSGSLPFHPMLCRSQLHDRPFGASPDIRPGSMKQLESESGSETESRIQELEDENIGLRQMIFNKDREIRKLRAERKDLCADAGVQVGMKRTRIHERVGGPVREQ
ncbi:hypothetical protein N0V90_000810 [Kalmusia sp. IMI 367209]|nr:hypothetical protein N0V90_000810 [Kalmusia sp. IMI 367209]